MKISKNEYFQFPSITSQFYNISALARTWFSFGSAAGTTGRTEDRASTQALPALQTLSAPPPNLHVVTVAPG
jgi:hypothetical protein